MPEIHSQVLASEPVPESHPQALSSEPLSESHPQVLSSEPLPESHSQVLSSEPLPESHPHALSNEPLPESHSHQVLGSEPLPESHPQALSSEPLSESHPQVLSSKPLSESHPQVLSSAPLPESHPQVLSSEPLPESHPQVLSSEPLPESHPQVLSSEPLPESHPQVLSSEPLPESHPQVLSSEPLPESHPQVLSSEPLPESHPQVLSSEPLPESHHQVLSHEEVVKHKERVLQQASNQSQLQANSEVLLHLWDCGGQPVFLDSLPAFMSSRTVFLIVFDASKDLEAPFRLITNDMGHKKDDGELKITTLSLLKKWMASIHARFGSNARQQRTVPDYPRIILVGTHADQLASDRRMRKQMAAAILNRLFTSIRGMEYADMVLCGIVVDNTTAGKGSRADSDFEVLRRKVYSFVQDKLTEDMPVSWVHFRKVMQLHTRKQKPVISLDEVYSIAAECHVPHDEVPSALLFYHELGVFFFYPNIEGLKSVVILEPQWLVDRFGELFASWKGKAEYSDMWNTLTHYGILVEPLYEAVLGNVREYNLTPAALIEMLEHFLLAAPIVTTKLHGKSDQVKEYFVPHMLRFHLAMKSSHSKGRKVKAFFSSLISPQQSRAQNDKIPLKKAAPVHLTFLSGYVPPGYYVRLATSLASKEGVLVHFYSGIYRDQITMDIGVDRLIITEHSETVELQFSRQLDNNELPFKVSCRKLLNLLHVCFSEVHKWLPGAIEQLAFSCLECASAAQPDVPSRAKFCHFTFNQSASRHLQCQVGHLSLPTHSHKCWLFCNTINQLEQNIFEVNFIIILLHVL